MQARSLNLVWTCLESFPGLPCGLETWPVAPEARADPQRFLGKTQGPDRQPEITPRVWGMRSLLQEGKSRCFRMETHGDMEADVGQQLEETDIWIREMMQTAREHWTAVLMEKRMRTFPKAWIWAVRQISNRITKGTDYNQCWWLSPLTMWKKGTLYNIQR